MGDVAKTFCEKKIPCDIIYEATEKGKNLKEIVQHIEDGNAQD
jgi:DNA-binding HxlR family transcriptional regulator